ncbi:uncharacterized protein FTJAE_7834 [Fusarium tjaetaba]|uniref:Uncharacterized protein n=1 Tax=Fusarium tjaetaba TaxID=1567544 RepID=A0A8H5RER1_9HYPO|nr:uncharacterized protein FTJAE_7834 [Fusarium tjaetaba]KAF5631633.1 hypothetical protein FTJAE_7834 [Fusarium tjaetaba]
MSTSQDINNSQSPSTPRLSMDDPQNTQKAANGDIKKDENLVVKDDVKKHTVKESIKAFLKRKQDQRKLRKIKNVRKKLVKAGHAYGKALDTMDANETIEYLESVWGEIGLLG